MRYAGDRKLLCNSACGVPILTNDEIEVETTRAGRAVFHWRCWSDWDTLSYFKREGYTDQQIARVFVPLGPPRRAVV